MNTYRVSAEREDGWWVILAEVGKRTIATQARRLDEVETTVREAIGMVLDIDEDAFDVDITPVLPADLAADVVAARELAEHAAVAREQATARSVALAAALTAQGYTVRDVGALMGVSSQRVSQLVAMSKASVQAPQRRAS